MGRNNNARGFIEPQNERQRAYWKNLRDYRLNFALGAAGTGKTLLGVDAALEKLNDGDINKIILTTPVVDADEGIGDLPGEMHEKMAPYMQALYDAFTEAGLQSPHEKMLRGEIEIAPLSYMRGRTFMDAFVILDEAQNTTPAQIKMFLTRMGHGTHMAVTGDHTQSDLNLPQNGLAYAFNAQKGMQGIGTVEFYNKDSLRDPMVAQMLQNFDDYDARRAKSGPNPQPK